MIPAHDTRMLATTPFHARTAAACELNEWEPWKGYTTVAAYSSVELEYFSIRNACGLFDLCPMTKYRITGPDAGTWVDRLVTRDTRRLAIGQVMYVCWCDDAGQVMDDGTLFRLGEDHYRICTQQRHLDWFRTAALGFDVTVHDETAEVAALALQGPTSCAVLRAIGLDAIEMLRPYRGRACQWRGRELYVSRTGFTGDLGYELWIDPAAALTLWDALIEAGDYCGIRPFGSRALAIARIEAGFIQANVDFVPAMEAVRPDRTRSPWELGLGWLVDLSKPLFNGRSALINERRRGSRHALVRLDVDGNKPANHSFIFDERGKRAGTVTSATWSPILKSNLAYATVRAAFDRPDSRLYAEIYYLRELQWTRVMERSRVSTGAWFDPPRRRATPAGNF
jgi:aminomethyltransferase